MKDAMLRHKREIKYKKYDYNTKELEILGVGEKAIKYSIDGGEPEFAYHDSPEGHWISIAVLTSFDNEVWNDDIRANIKAQKEFCSNGGGPHFAPENGFCWSCGHQIHTKISLERASNDLITGCPHCMRSYCD